MISCLTSSIFLCADCSHPCLVNPVDTPTSKSSAFGCLSYCFAVTTQHLSGKRLIIILTFPSGLSDLLTCSLVQWAAGHLWWSSMYLIIVVLHTLFCCSLLASLSLLAWRTVINCQKLFEFVRVPTAEGSISMCYIESTLCNFYLCFVKMLCLVSYTQYFQSWKWLLKVPWAFVIRIVKLPFYSAGWALIMIQIQSCWGPDGVIVYSVHTWKKSLKC